MAKHPLRKMNRERDSFYYNQEEQTDDFIGMTVHDKIEITTIAMKYWTILSKYYVTCDQNYAR